MPTAKEMRRVSQRQAECVIDTADENEASLIYKGELFAT